ncbi:PAS domain S-box protein [Pseudodesulfovibrio sp. zrk46]|nr:PAS domain S-box protein [Pseudodesulfovibrio sp. zrk46]
MQWPDEGPTAAELPPHLFKQVVEASGVPMAIRRPDLWPIYSNQAFLDLYGYTLAEVRAQKPRKMLLEETWALYRNTVIPCMEVGRSWEGDYVIRCKNGRLRSIWGHFDPVMDESGKLTHVISIMRDDSASQRLRKALQQTERHLNFLADNTSDCLFRLRTTDGRYDYISSAMESITGYKPQEFYENPNLFKNIAPASWLPTLEMWWQEMLEGNTRYEYTSPLYHKDGSLKWISQRITLVQDDYGTPAAVEGIITDVTQQRVTEDALRESESRYRLIVETLDDVIWTADNDLQYTYVSPAVEKLTGFTPEEYMTMDLADTMKPESMTIIKEMIARRTDAEAQSDGGNDYTNRFEAEAICKDGFTIWTETLTRRLYGPDDEKLGYLGITRDITPRREAALAIQKNEDRYRTLFEDSPISLWEEDLTRLKVYFDDLRASGVTDFRQYFYDNPEALGKCATLVDVVSVNKATLDLLRARDQEELLGNLDKVLTESSMAAFTEEMILLASGGCEYCGEITHRTLEGDVIWVVVNFSVPPEYQDSLSRVIVSLIDVTPRKRAEQALMESEERYRVVVENAQEGVVVVRDEKVLFANEAMTEILGYSAEELENFTPFELVHPDDRSFIVKQFSDFLAGKRNEGFASARTLTKLGETRWVTFSLKPIMWGGEKAYMEILTDITSHKVLEEELLLAHAEMEDRVARRTAELSEANIRLTDEVGERRRAQNQILSLTQQLLRIQEDERQRISRDLHDNIAQDLSSIILNMETLFDHDTEVDPAVAERARAVTDIVQGAVQSVRDIAYGLRPPALDQLGLTLALERHCADVSRRSGVDVDFFTAGMENLTFDFDTEINIYRMIQEALGNVARHAEASKVAVRMVKSHPDLLIRIADNGKGFDVDERLEQVAEERRMGLRSMEERARLVGGSMEIESRLGTGTRIIFKIPTIGARRQ